MGPILPPTAPTAAEKCSHSTETYILAREQIHQLQTYVKLLLGCRVGRGTLAL
jgi:hypothetical protein